MMTLRVDLAALLIALVTTISATSAKGEGLTRLPGPPQTVWSPTGKYELVNQDFLDRMPAHELIIKARDGHIVLSRWYRRHVDVSWSHSDNLLFLNDYAGSNVTECILITLDGYTATPRNLVPELIKAYPGLHLSDYIHVHVSAIRWLTSHSLIIDVWAYASPTRPGGIEKWYTFDTYKGFEPR